MTGLSRLDSRADTEDGGDGMQEIPKAIIDGAGSMSQATMLWIMGVMVGVITTLGQAITALVNKRSATALQQTNPLNGTLAKLDITLREVNTTLTKVDIRAEDSNRILARHSEQLVAMGVATTQLAANEAAQTRALLELGPAIDKAITGVASRITDNCTARSGAILSALDNG